MGARALGDTGDQASRIPGTRRPCYKPVSGGKLTNSPLKPTFISRQILGDSKIYTYNFCDSCSHVIAPPTK